MKPIHLVILLLTSTFAFSQTQCDQKDFEMLKTAVSKSKLTNSEFNACLATVKKLETNQCFEYVQNNAGQELIETSLTALFGKLCFLANTERAVKEYIGYLKRNPGSAEEERSISFEYLFKQNPERTLALIQSDRKLLDHVAWGFINNRANTKQILNGPAVQDLFFTTYPSLKEKQTYRNDIAYLLLTIEGGSMKRKE